MRLLQLCALASPILAAVIPPLHQDESFLPVDRPAYRVDCDDWASVRPREKDIWRRAEPVEMDLTEVQRIITETAKERGYEEFRILSCELSLAGKPFYEVELLTKHFNEKRQRDVYRRHEVRVGLILREVKYWVPRWHVPGAPALDDELETLPSGVMVADIKPGDGAEVREDSVVNCHYQMLLLDGTLVFDTFNERAPLTMRMSHTTVPGLRDGLLGMRVGGKRKIIVPPELGYGDEGLEDLVPPGATLTYDLVLREVR